MCAVSFLVRWSHRQQSVPVPHDRRTLARSKGNTGWEGRQYKYKDEVKFILLISAYECKQIYFRFPVGWTVGRPFVRLARAGSFIVAVRFTSC